MNFPFVEAPLSPIYEHISTTYVLEGSVLPTGLEPVYIHIMSVVPLPAWLKELTVGLLFSSGLPRRLLAYCWLYRVGESNP